MLQIVFTRKMKRDIKLMIKRGKDISKLTTALTILANLEAMPAQYRDHQLRGDMSDFRECHLESDWLLLYQVFQDILVLSASGTGSHADLFGV